jgi:diadenosine tetraphosphate (Ap4A) HIT family hydrolase
MEKCRFCKLSQEHSLKIVDTRPCYDRVLNETENFLVVPTLGSIVPGYVMIISRMHIYSMAQTSDKEMEELLNLIEHTRLMFTAKFILPTIAFEHGSANGCFDMAANSVDHAHIHILPVDLSMESEIIKDAKAVQIPAFHETRTYRNNPYLLFINDHSICYISHGTVLPRQYMRRLIAKETGHPDEWDWKQYAFENNVKETIDALYSQITL